MRRSRFWRSMLIGVGGACIVTSGVVAAEKLSAVATARARTDRPGVLGEGTLLPSGWTLRPAGRQIPIGDLPVAMEISPDGGHLLVSTAGYSPCQVISIDTDDEQKVATQTLDQTWEGMAFDPDGKQLFVSGGGRAIVWRFDYEPRGGDIVRKDPIPVADLKGRDAPYARGKKSAPGNPWIGGLAVSTADHSLFALNTTSGTLYALDAATGQSRREAKVGDHPVAVALSPDGAHVYVANEGSGTVSVFEASTLNSAAQITVGTQPAALVVSRDGKRLYVANSGSDTVSVVDTASNAVRETIRTAMSPQAPAGSSPNALALSPAGDRLFVANAGNNNVAVIDVATPAQSRVLGFIPTGWYPTALAVSRDGSKLFVGAGKGLASRPSYPRAGGGVGLSIYNRPGQSYVRRAISP